MSCHDLWSLYSGFLGRTRRLEPLVVIDLVTGENFNEVGSLKVLLRGSISSVLQILGERSEEHTSELQSR